MTDREKLIQLLIDSPGLDTFLGDYDTDADFLLANGVTFATDTNVGSKWIPVTERLPEKTVRCLVYGSRGGIYTAEFRKREGYHVWHKLNSKSHYCEPTHWMPLPEPPKNGVHTHERS